MRATIIRNGRVIDPANKRDEVIDLLIIDGKIAPLSQLSTLNSQLDEINASNLIVCPGLIDMHVHLRRSSLERAPGRLVDLQRSFACRTLRQQRIIRARSRGLKTAPPTPRA